MQGTAARDDRHLRYRRQRRVFNLARRRGTQDRAGSASGALSEQEYDTLICTSRAAFTPRARFSVTARPAPEAFGETGLWRQGATVSWAVTTPLPTSARTTYTPAVQLAVLTSQVCSPLAPEATKRPRLSGESRGADHLVRGLWRYTSGTSPSGGASASGVAAPSPIAPEAGVGSMLVGSPSAVTPRSWSGSA